MEWSVKFISPFLQRFPETHDGFRVEFRAPMGVPIRAMADGMIIRAGWDNPKDPQEGLGLRIRHLVSLPGFDSWMLVYGHLGKLKTYLGRKVKRGETIALSGGPMTLYLFDRNKDIRQIPFESD